MAAKLDRLSHSERATALRRMAGDGLDILVIGGGIAGVGVAMDAAVRGYSVGLVEKGDFASGTSSKSTKLAHGGLRYLPQLDFSLVREAIIERGLLFANAPWLVQPRGFVLPLYNRSRHPLGLPIAPPLGIGLDLIVQSGLVLYDSFAGARRLPGHRKLSVKQALSRAPALRPNGLAHAFLYYDGQTDDTRLTLTVLRTAVLYGALAANYAEVVGFDMANGRIAGAKVRDNRNSEEQVIEARHFVNAAGVFAERVEALTSMPSELSIAPAKGVHLVFSRDAIPMGEDAVVLPETDDGRLLFLIPWEGRVLVGTTDTEGGDIDDPAADEVDIAYLLAHCNRYLARPIVRRDILGTFSGFRPLVRSKDDKNTSKISRSHAVLEGPGQMVTLVGGKLTTWRRMAEDTINMIAQSEGLSDSDATKETPLDGMLGWPVPQPILAGARDRFGRDVAAHLQEAYGGHMPEVLEIAAESKRLDRRIVPDLPYLMAEAAYASRYEMALTLADFLCRRTHIVLLDKDQGLSIAGAVAGVMAGELGWDEAEIERQVADYHAVVRREYSPF